MPSTKHVFLSIFITLLVYANTSLLYSQESCSINHNDPVVGEDLYLEVISNKKISKVKWTGPLKFNSINQKETRKGMKKNYFGTYSVIVTHEDGSTCSAKASISCLFFNFFK